MWRCGFTMIIRICGACLLCSSLAVSVPFAFSQRPHGIAALQQGSAAKVYARYDIGELPDTAALRPMHLMLAQTLAKKNALTALTIAQQDIHSDGYHRWISPEEFAQKFGAQQEDIEKLAAWLQSCGMKNIQLSRGHNMISFTATVPIVEQAFQVKMHRFQVRGEEHYANVSEPIFPESLNGTVSSIQGLNDFVPRVPRGRTFGTAPAYVSGVGGTQGLGPGDLAVLYDVKPMYVEAATGAQPSIGVVGSADASLDDFHAYKKLFGLPANDYQVVRVPGSAVATTAEAALETALDLQIAGGIAPQAKLIYIEAGDIFAAAAYAVDNRVADVLSLSYTICELPSPDDFAYESLAQQAVVEGMTWVNASGDSGAAGCDQAGAESAISGLAVNLPASLPEVTGVGGTRFTSLSSSYWSDAATTDGTTALSYVPETAWNGLQDKELLTASGGGISKEFFKPGYQSSVADGVAAREVPDIAFDAAETSPAYLVLMGGRVQAVAGTSAATPLFAGITATLNQYLLATGAIKTSGLGNINPTLYRLAQVAPQVFHDTTTGTNIVSCAAGSVDCTDGSLGYSAGVGYDNVTGLGSIDVARLAHAWSSADIRGSTTSLSAAAPAYDGSIALTAEVQAAASPSPGVVVFSWTNPSYSSVPAEFARVAVNADGVAGTSVTGLPNGSNAVSAVFQGTTALLGSVSTPVVLEVTVTDSPAAAIALVDVPTAFPQGIYMPLAAVVSGRFTMPTGVVDFFAGSGLIGSAPVAAGAATAVSAVLLPVGTNVLTAHYSGDSMYAAKVSDPVTITVVGTAPPATVASPPVPDFTITVPTTLTVSQGENGDFPITISPLNGFSAPVTLTCSGPISGYGCFVPATVTPKTLMKIQGSLQSIALSILPLGSMLFFGGWARRQRRWFVALVTLGILLQTGCGLTVNKTAAASAAAVYPVTITAVSGDIQHTAILSVTVEQ